MSPRLRRGAKTLTQSLTSSPPWMLDLNLQSTPKAESTAETTNIGEGVSGKQVVEVESDSQPPKPQNWLEGAGRIWREEMRGEPPWKQLAHALKDIWGDPKFEARFRRYLRITEPRFVSLPRFVATFGTWDVPGEELVRSRYPTADEADRKAGILP